MKQVKISILVALIASLLSQASAEVKKIPATGSNGYATIDHIADAKKSWIAPRQIRCWQEGRLIVEENDWVPGDMHKQVSFLRNNEDVLYMFDFNKTFCMYRKSEVRK